MPTLDNAIQKLQQGRLEEGQRILEKLLEHNPSDPKILYNLGICYSEQGMLEESIQTLERCIALASKYGDAYAALGFSYARNGQSQKAIAILNQGLEIDPKNFYILKNLGAIYGKLGRIEEAIAYFESADEINPGMPEILYGLAVAYEEKDMLRSADLMYQRLIEREDSRQFAELAKEARTRIGVRILKSKAPRYDAVMYCLGALQKFSKMSIGEVQQITFEIAMLGQGGLDINDPERKYRLQSLSGQFSGLHLLCYMYVGFKMIDPTVDIGADLSEEYQEALKIFEERALEG